MSKIVWDKTGERYLESGVSHGVLYKSLSGVDPLKQGAFNSYDAVNYNYQYEDSEKRYFGLPGTYAPSDNAVLYHYGGSNSDKRILTYKMVLIRQEVPQPDGTVMIEDRTEYQRPEVPFPEILSAVFDDENHSAYYYRYIGYIERKDWENLSAWRSLGGYDYARLDSNKLYVGSRSPTGNNTLGGKWYLGYNPNSLTGTQRNGPNMYGVAWNGLISISDSPEGAENNDIWADNMKYAKTQSPEIWTGTIEAYQSPIEFDECDGSEAAADGVNVGQQKRVPFGLSYRTEIMNDASGGESCGYLLHLLYNLTASPSERSYETINDSPDAMTLSWDVESTPMAVSSRHESVASSERIFGTSSEDGKSVDIAIDNYLIEIETASGKVYVYDLALDPEKTFVVDYYEPTSSEAANGFEWTSESLSSGPPITVVYVPNGESYAYGRASSAETYTPIAEITIDSRYAKPVNLKKLEMALYGYGDDSHFGPVLPSPDAVISMMRE